MAVRADWHEDAVVAVSAPGSSPFDLASSVAMRDLPLSLDLTVEQLGDKIRALFKREKFLFDRMGLSCPVKDKCDTTCLACPLNEANDPESRKGSLCKVGMAQDQAETLLAVKLDPGSPVSTAPAAAPPPAPEPEPMPALKW